MGDTSADKYQAASDDIRTDNATGNACQKTSQESVLKRYIVVNPYGSAVRNVRQTGGLRMYPPFAYYQKDFIFYFIGKADSSQLQAAYPSGYIGVLHGIKDITEFISFFRCIFFGALPINVSSSSSS